MDTKQTTKQTKTISESDYLFLQKHKAQQHKKTFEKIQKAKDDFDLTTIKVKKNKYGKPYINKLGEIKKDLIDSKELELKRSETICLYSELHNNVDKEDITLLKVISHNHSKSQVRELIKL